MTTKTNDWEQRSATREIASGSIWWYRHDQDAEIRTGQLFDQSRSGIAYMTSSDYPLKIGDRVDLTLEDPRCGDPHFETVRVVRIEDHSSETKMVSCTRFP